jgi:hypothetical protein
MQCIPTVHGLDRHVLSSQVRDLIQMEQFVAKPARVAYVADPPHS